MKISVAISKYLHSIKLTRSNATMLAYRNAMQNFSQVLKEKGIDPSISDTQYITENIIAPFVNHLRGYASSTEQLYLQAVKGFYIYLDAERLSDINQSHVVALIRQRSRRSIYHPQFPSNDVETLLGKAGEISNFFVSDNDEDFTAFELRAYRDCAFLLTLADTGLRVHEACNLKRGDIDWKESRTIIIGKGNKQAVVRFTSRALQSIKAYLSQRATLDGNSGKQLSALPLFARHDKGAGKKIKPITPTTGRNIVSERVEQFLGKDSVGKITPHSFRHYFVTSVLRGTGNLKIAQELARHENIEVTKRYSHLSNDELDKAYHEVFERKK